MTESKMNFSLIVPIHNTPDCDRRSYINELLESLPDRADLEIILVDDHSTLSYKPARQFLLADLVQAPNTTGSKYAGTARNTGLDLARGRFVFFADSDDKFLMEKLDATMNAALETDGYDLLIARSTSFKEDGSTGDRHHHVDEILGTFARSKNVDDLVKYHAPWGKFVSLQFVREHGLRFTSHRVANDVIFSVTLALHQPRVTVLDTIIYAVRQGNVSLTSDVSTSAVRTRLEVARQIQDAMKRAGRKDLLRPLHYRLREYARSHPTVALSELLVCLKGGYRVFSPPSKMLATALRKAKFRGS